MTQESGSPRPGARARLLAMLREIADLAGERSLRRCPYRAVGDVCTFRGECGNRYRRPGARALCTGGPLNARKADEEEVARAFEGTGTQAQGGTGKRPQARGGAGGAARPRTHGAREVALAGEATVEGDRDEVADAS